MLSLLSNKMEEVTDSRIYLSNLETAFWKKVGADDIVRETVDAETHITVAAKNKAQKIRLGKYIEASLLYRQRWEVGDKEVKPPRIREQKNMHSGGSTRTRGCAYLARTDVHYLLSRTSCAPVVTDTSDGTTNSFCATDPDTGRRRYPYSRK